MFVLIPSYQPDIRLVGIVSEIREALPAAHILVVDDGSGPTYASFFNTVERLGGRVIRHSSNRGKGAALKLGFEYIRRGFPKHAVVTADSDGQHRIRDIARVAEALLENERPTVILGGRGFTGEVPARSRFGNLIARSVFRFTTGLALHDTQTGLRGYPAELLEWACTVPGQRFEYELSVLLEAAQSQIPVREILIETVYLEHNESSHFRPVADSLRVLRPFLSFGAVSFLSFVVDFVMLLALHAITGNLLLSVVGARLLSGSFNFVMNRKLVFRAEGGRTGRQAMGYLALALALLAGSYLSLAALTTVGVPLAAAKVASEIVLYLVSYGVQRRFIFRRRSTLVEPNRAEEPLLAAA
ncbi:MAG: GtrA family protein [Microbacteriaceae bacterium]